MATNRRGFFKCLVGGVVGAVAAPLLPATAEEKKDTYEIKLPKPNRNGDIISISPEDLEDIRNLEVDEIDYVTRKEVFLYGGLSKPID